MKLGLVGANGSVGTELCFLLMDDVKLKPIIRNKLGAVFLKYHGFDCHIADIAQKNDAMESLSDIDLVVIASYATDPFSGSQTQSSQHVNEQLIKNAVKFSNDNSTIIYFSTIRAFSHKIDPNTPRFWLQSAYDKEKKHLELVLFSECAKQKKRGFALRIGLVVGDNQSRTREIKKKFSKKNVLVQVSPEKKSNIVHTVTIKDAILRCAKSDIKPGLYSVVNNPQWTWADVFEYYKNKETKIDYKPSTTKLKKSNSLLWNILKSKKKYLTPIRYYLPRRFDKTIQQKLSIKRMMLAISTLKNEDALYLSDFSYESIPGPFIPNLKNTKELLKNYSLDVFNYPKIKPSSKT